jgi:hypothetical protein
MGSGHPGNGSEGADVVIDRDSQIPGVYLSYIMVWNPLVVIHFYVGGLVWAFKDSFVRQTIRRYLVLGSHQV